MIRELKKPLEQYLYQFFGHEHFRYGQKEMIEDILQGNDVLGILPTGTGKSICYQLPSLLMKGTTIVVSPLISLMVDQVKQLKMKGFKKAIAINSFLNFQDKQQIYNKLHQYEIIYCSPEMLQNKFFLDKVKQIHVSLFVIDEAHCISQWGHEFRTDYLKLKDIIKQLNSPNILALSATATPEVQADIMKQLDNDRMKKHIYPMDRENIAFAVEKFSNPEEKLEKLISLLTEKPVPTMIYFSSKQWVEYVANSLSERIPHLNVAFYHGGLEQTDRLLIQQQFMQGQLDVICCTSAFGMGIDKSDIRMVIHFHVPTQLESFIQEVGRAGRDGKESISLVLYSDHDYEIPKHLIEGELPEQLLLDQALYPFFELVKKGQKTTLEDEQILSSYPFNETQWGFIKYQLEKHGMIEENNVILSRQRWETGVFKIHRFLEQRKTYKEAKLNEMIAWVHSEDCRRKNLYQSFQSTLKQPIGYCCDFCNFKMEDWEPSVLTKQEENLDWKKELRRLFLQGEDK